MAVTVCAQRLRVAVLGTISTKQLRSGSYRYSLYIKCCAFAVVGAICNKKSRSDYYRYSLYTKAAQLPLQVQFVPKGFAVSVTGTFVHKSYAVAVVGTICTQILRSSCYRYNLYKKET